MTFDNERHCEKPALQGLMLTKSLIQCERANAQNTAVIYVKAPYEMADNAAVTALTFYGTDANIRRQIHDFDENIETGVRSCMIKNIKRPISSCIKKNFWRFIKAKRLDSSGTSPLTYNSRTISDNKGKARILNTQFKSVFTSENLSNLPSMGKSPFPEVQHIKISVDGVCKLLKNINITKATGPNSIPARFLKEMAEEISPINIHISAVIGHW